VRHANQFPVGKHGARPFVAVVQNDIHAGCKQFLIKLVSGDFDVRETVGADAADHQGEGRDGVRPNNAPLVVVLLDGRCREAGDADAVAAHFQKLRLAVFVQERGVHGPAVLGAEVEHMADLNAALDGQHTLAVGRQVAGNHIAEVCNQVRLGQVAAPVDAGHVEVGFIGTANPVSQRCGFAVYHQLHRLFQVQRPQVTRLAAKMVLDFSQRCKAKTGVQAGYLADLDLIHVMVATQQQQPDLRLDDLTCCIGLFRGQNQ